MIVRWEAGGGGALLEMKLSNELQIKATRIHEKSKCLSFLSWILVG